MTFDSPTLDQLNIDPSTIDTVQPIEQAHQWLNAFSTHVANNDVDAVVALFHSDGFWKDILTLTWDLRAIRGDSAIKHLLDHRLAVTGLTAFKLLEDETRGPTLLKPLPELVFVRFSFEFETTYGGSGIAVAFLVPTPNGSWKAWSLLTELVSLQGLKDKSLRDPAPQHVDWEDRRRHEISFEDSDPLVLIIGAGHSGLEIAARLEHFGVSALIIDRSSRIGDSWRTRYKALCLHDIFWYTRMPYLDFPVTWPVYCPASKMADWLESYASALDLNVWLSSSITSANFEEETKTWHVSLNRSGKSRTMVVKHLVFATGYGGGFPHMPDIPGKELYRGSVLHSTQFTSATEYVGKKVIVVGASNSAHDIALDLYRHGSDVVMIQRSATYVISAKAQASALGQSYNDHFPIEFADTLGVAMPLPTVKQVMKKAVAHVANTIDKDLLDGLAKAGFKTYLGPDGAGFVSIVWRRGAGSMYIDTGASKEIINGNIKVKNSPSITRFTDKGIELEGGTIVEGDTVVFATGYGELRDSVREVCGPEVAARVGKVWGLDAEGQIQGVWRRTGFPRLWIGLANMSRSRFHSLHLALQIKALEEGIVEDGEVYASM